jgi:hypothetical protein
MPRPPHVETAWRPNLQTSLRFLAIEWTDATWNPSRPRNTPGFDNRCRSILRRLRFRAPSLTHWNDHGATAVILYTGLASNNGRIGYARVDKDVGKRRLETIQIV